MLDNNGASLTVNNDSQHARYIQPYIIHAYLHNILYIVHAKIYLFVYES